MTTGQSDCRPEESARPLPIKRRGVFAAAWAMLATVILRKGDDPVEATSGTGGQGSLILGSNGLNSPNSATTITFLETGSNFTGNSLLECDADAFTSTGTADVTGVNGIARGSAAGVAGILGSVGSGFPAGLNAGVYGVADLSVTRGVFGQNLGSGTGVLGQSQTGIGVQGVIPAASSGNGIAIYGLNYSTYTGPGPGAGGFAVYGLSAKGHGLVGATASVGAAAVVGATNGVAGAYAAAFYGPVIVGGDLTVFGAKSAAVPHPDGTHRRLYCLECPESWFEDFGKAQLQCGEAIVPLDPEFAAVAELRDYHVFITPYDDHDLRVSQITPTGFTVRARDAGATGRFSWRVVAKRKDIAGERLARVTIPPEPTLPSPCAPSCPGSSAH